jgi:hypothetical protein
MGGTTVWYTQVFKGEKAGKYVGNVARQINSQRHEVAILLQCSLKLVYYFEVLANSRERIAHICKFPAVSL